MRKGAPQAPFVLSSIRNRADFLALRRGPRAQCKSFLIQAGKTPVQCSKNQESTIQRSTIQAISDQGDQRGHVRLGLTVTKKLGNAVRRNRIKRRLRAAAREIFPHFGENGTDYVIVARGAAYDRNYAMLLDDMKGALLRLRDTTI